ncbi:ATP-binding protein [Streptomyces sp. JJ66]|uniref:ATP-binding protein n=1 Tax=Streptomyces sp. JJ66 TaxID=2803843 RepID=UPI001C579732|nr:ATP-binding protein [Streptomyces sp. JJ66]MBW1604116.1 ATP-binding protein [Streptomyces sp. JJ66]
MSIWWSLHLRCEAASVPLARRLLLGAMETAGVEPDIAYELSLALSEACANAVEHGGGPDHTEGYRVAAYLDGDVCRIEVTDHGPGFTPTLCGPGAEPTDTENGRGLYLISALTDHVDVHNGPVDGAVVSFDKTLKYRADALLKVS